MAAETWEIRPVGPLRGTLAVPGDKSISHRALIFNSLASGPARVRGLLRSEDTRATVLALRAMSVDIHRAGNDLMVVPPKGGLEEPRDVVDCGNSGTSIRLLAGIAAGRDQLTVLTGDASLRGRPMKRIVDPLRKMGAGVDARQGGTRPPLVIRGGDLMMAYHKLPVASAQVKTCLFLAGLESGVAVHEPHQSRDHSERMLTAMGVNLRRDEEGWWIQLPTESLDPLDIDVPGDLSAAAFWLVAACIVPDSEIYLKRVGINPSRSGLIDALEAMGADLQVYPVKGDGPEPAADLLARFGPLVGTTISGELAVRCLDEIPILAVAAAFAQGDTVIEDAAELRVKESDRISRVVTGLRALGILVEERPDGMVIHGGRMSGPATIDASGDHRIAMSFAVAGLTLDEGVTITGAESVKSSYPRFRAHLERLTANG